jgi:hypothetical protein
MRHTVTERTYRDRHGRTVTEPLLVTLPSKRSEDDMEQICDVELLSQLSEFGGSVAIIRSGNLGDLLMLTPTLRELKSQLPGLELHVFCGESFTRVFHLNPHIESCRPLATKNVRSLTYSVSLNAYPENEPDSDKVDRTSLFGRAFGLEISDGQTEFVVTEEDRSKADEIVADWLTCENASRLIVLGPDSADKRRNLSDEFVDEFRRIAADAGYVTFTTGNVRGVRPDIGTLAAIMDHPQCEAVVSSDNGVYHLAAAACDTPTFPIFTSIRPELRCCWYENCHPIVTDVACAPCNEDRDRRCKYECVASIRADEVLRSVEDHIVQRDRG